MLCQKCQKNEATVFYKEVLNGKTHSYAFCPACAAQLYKDGEIQDTSFDFSDPFDLLSGKPFGLDNLFSGLFGVPQVESSNGIGKTVCPDCGMSVFEIRKTGMAGCPKCYENLRDLLTEMTRSIHGDVKHVGRVPGRLQEKYNKDGKLDQLKSELKDAIASENFEKAAKLRDEIKKMESDKQQKNGDASKEEL